MNKNDKNNNKSANNHVEKHETGTDMGKQEKLKSDYEKIQNIAARAQADLVNFRNRVQNENLEIRSKAEQRIVLKFIDVIDQFEKAIEAVENSDHDEKWFKGLQAVYKNFENVLTSEGFSRIESEGSVFDPRLHEAIVNTPTDEFDSGTVIKEFSRGYIKKENVVRPSMVEIATEKTKKPDGEI